MRKALLLGLLALWLGCACAAPPPGLSKAIDGLLADPAMQGAKVGVMVQSLRDGDIWYERQAQTPLIPASVTKLFTAAFALQYLTPEYRFTTAVLADGEIAEGTLKGTLILRGGGDPTLDATGLRDLARSLAAGDPARGIPPLKAVQGALCLDESFFGSVGPRVGPGWQQDDLPWAYASPASALCCAHNAVTVTVTGGAKGQPPTVTLQPDTAIFTIINNGVSGSGTQTLGVYPQGGVLRIKGRIAPGARVVEKVSVRNPRAFVAEQFRRALAAEEITVSETAVETRRGSDAQACARLATHESPPLREIIAMMLKPSDNHMAEQLRWTMLTQCMAQGELAERYGLLQREYLARTGLGFFRLRLVDGSGLSRLNAVTPANLTGLLAWMRAGEHGDLFYDALPIVGVDGTMARRLTGTPAAGNARCKTGTMTGVSSLAGYVHTQDGELLAFAIMANGYRGKAAVARSVQDGLLAYLAGVRSAEQATVLEDDQYFARRPRQPHPPVAVAQAVAGGAR